MSKLEISSLNPVLRLSNCDSPYARAGTGESLLPQFQLLQEDRVGHPGPPLGGGQGEGGGAGVGPPPRRGRQVQWEVAHRAQVEEEVPLQPRIVRDHRQLQPGRRQVLWGEKYLIRKNILIVKSQGCRNTRAILCCMLHSLPSTQQHRILA